MSNTLIMTVGLPRSGKSTWARTQKVPIVNPDSIRHALHGQPFVPQAEPYVWAIAHTMVAALFLAGHETIILDACNTSSKRRDPWESNLWETETVLFPMTADGCRTRALKDGREDLLPIIERMAAEWDDLEELREAHDA